MGGYLLQIMIHMFLKANTVYVLSATIRFPRFLEKQSSKVEKKAWDLVLCRLTGQRRYTYFERKKWTKRNALQNSPSPIFNWPVDVVFEWRCVQKTVCLKDGVLGQVRKVRKLTRQITAEKICFARLCALNVDAMNCQNCTKSHHLKDVQLIYAQCDDQQWQQIKAVAPQGERDMSKAMDLVPVCIFTEQIHKFTMISNSVQKKN